MKKATAEQITRYADMFAAMGTDSRLRIVQLLLSSHPDGMVVGEFRGSWTSQARICRITSTS